MTTLRDLELKQAYHKPEDDIAGEFYLPCMARSQAYDRAVGFFSSAIYVLAWRSIQTFVKNGGKMRIICSPILKACDIKALSDGYAARESEQGELLKAQFLSLLSNPETAKPAQVLASLVAIGVIDFKIAWVGEVAGGVPKRLFHDKLGIFRDSYGNSVVFKGSMNETWPALSLDGNLESVDVYVNWLSERENIRIEDEQRYFDRLWSGNFPGVSTISLPQITLDALVAASDPEHWPELVDEICLEIDTASSWSPEQSMRTPRPHQIAALECWQLRNRRGIFEHATGSGKTFTALCAIDDALKRGEVVLVLVPSDLLLSQWAKQIRETFGSKGLKLLICGGGHTDWKLQGTLRAWSRASVGVSPRVILATMQTASMPAFLEACKGGQHLFLIADEVHRIGASKARRILEINSGPRLGLSATPQRAGDPEGTAAIFEYFEGVVPPPFTLFDAIESGALTRYAYHIHTISLDSDEQDQWNVLSAEVRRLYARSLNAEKDSSEVTNRLKLLLIRRARIVKGARQKINAAVELVTSHYRKGQHWIVYCDTQIQLNHVRNALREAGCNDVFEYHAGMTGDPHQTLELFERNGGVIVSIRCLDEGIDIPAVSHALILASSKNPREFIQRRGRVLRKYDGKLVSHIYDVLVTPIFNPEDPPSTLILEGEIARAIEFGSYALNPGCITDLQRLAIQHGLDWVGLATTGYEEDEENEEEQ